ncbi:CDC48 family AAA ATPase [Candidatus Pacearchaeota archaeon]|nr:CDC48 family AAA ATPase [Candidatus Pacearchaeota archaeon]MBD3283362.1 CDC48 family AAA ATPase [Candidatus Pacearchaeota archaeon]
MKDKGIKLRVAEALQDDAYKGIARIDFDVMNSLGIRRGDIINIKGGRETVAIADKAYPADVGEGIIRIDGIIRKNARTGVSENITVTKADVKEAKKVTIAPAQRGIRVQGDLKPGLLGRTVVKGDIVVLGGVHRRKDIMGDDTGMDDIFGNLNEMFGNMGFGNFGGAMQQIRFVIVSVSPNKPCIITENTEIISSNKSIEVSEESVPDVTYEDIGGLTEEVKKIREMVEVPLKHPEVFETLGIEPPKGVLLHGPPGTGKTLLAKAVANESDANFLLLNGPEIMSKFYGESEKKLRDLFEEAEKNSPSVIFIDELDAIAPKREDSGGEVERRVVSQLLTMMDGLQSRGKVVVIGATNRLNSIDPALRRPGRFDRELEIRAPDKRGRVQILKIHTRGMPLIPPIRKSYVSNKINLLKNKIRELNLDLKRTKDKNRLNDMKRDIKTKEDNLNKLLPIFEVLNDDEKKNENAVSKLTHRDRDELNSVLVEEMIDEIASKTHGFVGADLNALAKEAAMVVLRKYLPKLELTENEEIPEEILKDLKVSHRDFSEALKVVRPSAMREVLVETPNIGWMDVGGLTDIKQELKEAIEWPLKYPQSFRRMGIRPPKGILLYGPPGTGKTLLAKAVAKESEANFIQIKGPSLLSMWVGKSEEGIRKVFERARQVSPCIVFFDEIDALASKRGMEHGTRVTERVLNQLLSEMDGIEDLSNVIVIGATNRPDMLDSALLRPGRFDRLLLVSSPNKKERENIFRIHTKNMPLTKDVDIEKLVERTEDYVGADIESLVREAAMLSLRENIQNKSVYMKHFEEALKKVRSSVSKGDMEKYKKIEENYLRSAKAALEAAPVSYLG